MPRSFSRNAGLPGRTSAWCSSRRGKVSGCSVTGSSSVARRPKTNIAGGPGRRILQHHFGPIFNYTLTSLWCPGNQETPLHAGGAPDRVNCRKVRGAVIRWGALHPVTIANVYKILIVEDVEVVADLQVLKLIRVGVVVESRRVDPHLDFSPTLDSSAPPPA